MGHQNGKLEAGKLTFKWKSTTDGRLPSIWCSMVIRSRHFGGGG